MEADEPEKYKIVLIGRSDTKLSPDAQWYSPLEQVCGFILHQSLFLGQTKPLPLKNTYYAVSNTNTGTLLPVGSYE